MCNWVTGLYFTKSNNYFTATTQNTTKLNMARPNPASMRNFWELKHKELKYPVYSRNDMSGEKKKKKLLTGTILKICKTVNACFHSIRKGNKLFSEHFGLFKQ